MQPKISVYAIPSVKMAGVKMNLGYTHADQSQIIINAVLHHFNVEWEQVNQISRKREFIIPRQVIMYLLYSHTSLTLEKIGGLFAKNFDHTTVVHARNTIQNHIETGLLQKDVIAILNKIA